MHLIWIEKTGYIVVYLGFERLLSLSFRWEEKRYDEANFALYHYVGQIKKVYKFKGIRKKSPEPLLSGAKNG